MLHAPVANHSPTQGLTSACCIMACSYYLPSPSLPCPSVSSLSSEMKMEMKMEMTAGLDAQGAAKEPAAVLLRPACTQFIRFGRPSTFQVPHTDAMSTSGELSSTCSRACAALSPPKARQSLV